MAKKQWIDHNGQEIPAQYVPTIVKERDRLARRIHKQAVKLSEQLEQFKEMALDKSDEMYEKMMEDNNVRTGKKGNYSISSFDKAIKVEVSVQERIEFDDLIQVAQEKINQYLEQKKGSVDNEIQQIINLAFKTSKGRLDVKRVLSLFSLKINHKLWLEAMDVLKQSINRNVSKRYFRVWEKDKNGDYKSVELNLSSL